jgi:hypothetical protein
MDDSGCVPDKALITFRPMPKPLALSVVLLVSLLSFVSCGGSTTPSTAPTGNPNTAKGEPDAEAQASGLAARTVQHDGSRLRFWLPEGMARHGRTFSYLRPAPLLVVMITELTVEKETLDDLISPLISGLGKGARETGRSKRNTTDVVHVDGDVKDVTVKGFLLKDGKAAATMFVLYNAADGASDAQKVLDSVELDTKATMDPLKVHGLELPEIGDLVVSDSVQNPMHLSSHASVGPEKPGDKSAFIKVYAPKKNGKYESKDLGNMIVEMVTPLGGDRSKLKPGDFLIDGVSAVEMTMPGKTGRVDTEIYVMVMHDGDGALLIGGSAAKAQGAEAIDEIRRMARSLRRSRVD